MSKVIYISPERRQKPHGKYWGMDVYESDVCYELAGRIRPMLERSGFQVIIAPLEQNIRQRAQWANENGVDYYLALHTNASTNGTVEGTATGCEMLAYQHPAAIEANSKIYEQLIALYPSKRGIRNGDAYVENNSTKMVSAYCEVIFHDNSLDAAWLLSHRQEAAEAIAKGICAYWGVPFEPEHTPQPPQPGRAVGWAEAAELLRGMGIERVDLQ